MTGIDFISIVLFLSGILTGITRGFVGGVIDIVGIICGVSLASIAYKAPILLFQKFNIIGTPVNILFFSIFSLLFILSVIVGIEVLKKKTFEKHIIDRIFGFFPGVIEGMFLSGFLLMIISTSPNAAKDIDGSKFTKYITRFFPAIYTRSDRIGITLPKNLCIPKEYIDEFNYQKIRIVFQKINFSKIKGTCIKCAGEIKFDGYFLKTGTAVIPKFICKNCGRVSDGCQVYEIFHLLYGKCPIDLAKNGVRFDCGRFPNREWITPKGPCPVDGKQLQLWEWQPPLPY